MDKDKSESLRLILDSRDAWTHRYDAAKACMRRRLWPLARVLLAAWVVWYTFCSVPSWYDTVMWWKDLLEYGPYTYTLSRQLEGWHNRTTPADIFQPKVEDLHIAVLYSAMAQPEGFGFALFDGGLLVDGKGEVVRLHEEDYTLIQELVTNAEALPRDEIWHVKSRVSCRTGYSAFAPQQNWQFQRAKGTQTSVVRLASFNDWGGNPNRLHRAVAGRRRLPEPLVELLRFEEENPTGPPRNWNAFAGDGAACTGLALFALDPWMPR
ncbi:hypothetical protein EXIGLDRAFT_729841 [Exidia glandulosa HHB12029]|uniref:Uncharacterized protein n=1 Tax=Exidia glandulosa HHB12029 TaxID=1314781 RepID=A0A165CEX6_EXIGL|nr:hypothetical protein EXIGLDRAFT_729841 [Exidia glandulosa HHB12029]